MPQTAPQALPIVFAADDGHELRGHLWRHPGHDPARPVVLINPATSVHSRYYARFADYLGRQGLDVLSYDYRGIGGSRPASLRGFEAGWIDWGQRDVEAVLQFVRTHLPGQPVQVVAHSVGGFLIGLAPSSHHVTRVFTVGAQYAHWRDYAREKRLRMLLKWHVAMPLLTALFGYFPGRRLGWLEDTPRGVVRDWTARHPRFEQAWREKPVALSEGECQQLVDRFAAVRGDTLALSLSDDEFGTIPAIQRLLAYYRNSARTHLHLRPQAVGATQIGHFAFFHSRFEQSLWPIALEWLRHGRVPGALRGSVVPLPPRA